MTLPADEARHATGSRRLTVGDRLLLFDGCGAVARGNVAAIEKRGRVVRIKIHEYRAEPRPKPAIHLACALPKGDRQAVLLDMATQLGMSRFTPLACARSVVKPGASSVPRWRRICIEACKQSHRLHAPEIGAPATPAEVAARALAAGDVAFVAHPEGSPLTVAQSADAMTLMIGPEGGFTDKEIAETRALGAGIVSLGSATLRVETAAVALLAHLTLGTGPLGTPWSTEGLGAS